MVARLVAKRGLEYNADSFPFSLHLNSSHPHRAGAGSTESQAESYPITLLVIEEVEYFMFSIGCWVGERDEREGRKTIC